MASNDIVSQLHTTPVSGPEMDNCEDREGYSLACGFSLGLILLGMGNESLPGLDDLKLTDRSELVP